MPDAPKPATKTMTLAAAARLLGRHRNTVRMWVRIGYLHAMRCGHVYQVPVSEVRRLLRQHHA